MASPHSNGGKISFETVAKSVSWLEKGKKPSSNKLPKRKPVTIEMSALAEEAISREPHELARDGEYSMFKALFESTTLSVRFTDGNGSSLLHAAASSNQVQIMQYLIENNAPLNLVDNEGNTPLHIATLALALEAIHLLLDKAANDSILNNNQDAPLHIAIRTGNLDLVNAFLQHENINLIVQGYRNRTPLHIAAELDLVDIAAAFSNAIIVVKEWKEKASFRLCAADSDNVTPIHFAARCGSANVLRYMMSHCTEHGYPRDSVLKFIDEEDSTPMHIAIDSGHMNVLKVLLEFGASPLVQNGNQIPPLHLACYQGRMEMVEVIVEHSGPEVINVPSKNGQTPLHWGSRSIQGGRILQYLISKGANLSLVDNLGQTALHYAIIFGSLEAVRELIKCNCSISTTDNLGRNIIHQAVLHNRTAIIRLLLRQPNASDLVMQQDKSGHCAVHYALEKDHEDLILCLVSAIESKIVNLKNENGFNYLHSAAKSGNWKALSVLLDLPASSLMINEVDNEGSTPLHQAAIHGHLTCVGQLLSHGAMIHKCYCGFTPFLAAVRNGNKDCAEVLFKAHPFQREWTDDVGNTALQQAVSSCCPHTLKLCLDLGIPINRNELGETFLDMLITKSSQDLLLLVAEHPRFQECLDFPPLEGSDHPFLRLIKNCPHVAKTVLDRCHETSPLPRTHCQYYENYDFKYLRLLEEDLDDPEIEKAVDESGENDGIKEDMMSEVSVKIGENRFHNAVVGRGAMRSRPLQALKSMLRYNRVDLLTHPVVVQYLKLKWRAYGRPVVTTQFFLFFFQVVLLSLFVLLTPPARLDVDDITYELLSNNLTLSEVSVASSTIRVTAIFVCTLNSILLTANTLSIGLKIINIWRYEAMWMVALTMCTSYAFLIPWKYSEFGFKFIYWEAGAITTFTSWFSLILFVKPFDLFGVYVTMFTEVLSTLIKVLFICVLFLFAFAFPFYILVGDAHPFTNFGDSLFITFSYMLGEIDYAYYVRRSDNDSLQHPNLTYIFVVVAAGMLAVAVANFLIGLAVGDIDSIRRNAVVKQRSDKVRIFSRIDVWLPKFMIQKYNKRFHTIHPNAKVHMLRRIWRYFWRAIKDESEEDKDVYKLLADQQRELFELKKFIHTQADTNARGYDELKHLLLTLSSRMNRDNGEK